MSDTTAVAQPAAQTTQAAPTTPDPKPPEKTTEKPFSALRAALGIKDPAPEKKDEKPAPEKKEPKPEKAAEKPPEKADAPKDPDPELEPEKKVKRVAKPVAKVEGADDLKRATENLAKAADDIRKAAKPEKPEEVKLDLPEEIDVEEIKALEELDPKKFKGLEQKARKFWGKGGQEDQYIAAWKKANPGQQFDADAPEHSDFYSENEPFVTDAERKAAQRHIGAKIAEKRAEEAAKKVTEPVQRQLARERAEKVAEPQRATWEQDLIRSSVEAADPEAKGIDVSKLADEHPLLHGVVTQIHETVKPAITELFALKNGAPFDSGNQVHTTLMQVAEQLQETILQQPEDSRELPVLGAGGKIVGYKSFAPMREFYAMSRADQARHWTVNEDVILNAIQNDVRAATASGFKAEADKITKFGGTVKRKTAATKPGKTSVDDAEKAADTDPDAKPVEATATAPTPTPKSENDNDPKKRYPSLMRGLGIA